MAEARPLTEIGYVQPYATPILRAREAACIDALMEGQVNPGQVLVKEEEIKDDIGYSQSQKMTGPPVCQPSAPTSKGKKKQENPQQRMSTGKSSAVLRRKRGRQLCVDCLEDELIASLQEAKRLMTMYGRSLQELQGE